MYLTGNSSRESTQVQTQRAGLRVAPAPGQPTGLFEVIEMAVLVIVTALAMASIIVAGTEDDSRQQARDSSGSAEQRPVARDRAHREEVAAYASADAHRPTAVATNR